MTVRQIILKFIYPLFSKISSISNSKQSIVINTGKTKALVPFYSLKANLANNTDFDFAELKGKKVLIVNLASNCGFTPQYRELERLSQLYKSQLVVLGFPANDFKEQEPGSDVEIEKFCRVNYNVSFNIFKKASVLKPVQQDVYQWLATSSKNGWNDTAPAWNFSKYLVDEKGDLQATIKSQVSPLNVELLKIIETPQ